MCIPTVKKCVSISQVVDGNIKLLIKILQFHGSIKILRLRKIYYKCGKGFHVLGHVKLKVCEFLWETITERPD